MSTATETVTFKVGDKVVINPTAGWSRNTTRETLTITKVPGGNRKKYEAVDSTGMRYNGPAYAFMASTGDPLQVRETLYQAIMACPAAGTVVQINGVRNIDPSEFWVVLNRSTKGGVKVTKLGGWEDRYYTHIPLDKITVVDVDTLAQLLAV